MQQPKAGPVYIYISAIALLTGGLYLLSLFNYLLYHTLIELFGIIIAVTVFVIGWSTRKYSKNNMVIILAAGYLAVASIDLLHTVTFKGMGVFPQYDSNVPTQFWVAARYVESTAFLLAALYLGRPKMIRPEIWLCGFLTAGALLTYAVFAGIFPESFVEGQGLTGFKIVSEYIISAIFFAAGFVFWKKRASLGRNILRLLLLAGAFTILSELSFTLYVDVYGFFNYLGHIFKLFSIAFIYRALVYESLTNPFQLLFREVADASEKLSHSEKIFRDLVEQSSDWVWEVDREGKLTYSNPRAKELTGYEPVEILGRTPFEFMTRDGALKSKEDFLEAAARGEPFYRFESTLLHKNGQPIVFETSGTPAFNEQEELTGYRGIARDITQRKKAEQELMQARDEAEQANRARSSFLANISHEIRTPMNVIVGSTDILYKSELKPDQKEWVEMIKKASASLMAVIDDLLDFSRIEAGRLELEQTRFHLPQEVERTVALFAQQAREKGLRLSCSIDADIPEVVMGDPTRLRQVLFSLVDNAIKFTEQGEVVVSLQPAGTGGNGEGAGEEPGCSGISPVFFSIRDTGIGVPLDQADHLFEGFTQADASDSRKYEGAGLGLPISKNLVELMGGSLGVKSEENRGSTFYFTIPFDLPQDTGDITGEHFSAEPGAFSPAEASEVPEEQPLEWGERGLEILLVEDKPMSQKMAAALLENKGHRVTAAKTGREALEALQKRRFDLILMDVHMPEMDGLEATAHIRAAEEKSGGHIPIAAMTAYAAMQEDRDRCLQAGMDYYISKPLSAEELYRVLARVTANKRDKPVQQVQQAPSPQDVQEMLQRVDGNRELLEELWGLFFQDYSREIEVLKESLGKNDAPALAVAAHGLKGELGNLGMKTAYRIACELERLAKENKLEEAASLSMRLEQEIQKMEHFFFNV